MKFFVDTGDLAEITDLASTGLLDGANAANDFISEMRSKAAARKAAEEDIRRTDAENTAIVQEGVEALASA